MMPGAGTDGYICPDYNNGLVDYSEPCEVYSFGIVLAELLCGKLQYSLSGAINRRGQQTRLQLQSAVREIPHDTRAESGLNPWPAQCIER